MTDTQVFYLQRIL